MSFRVTFVVPFQLVRGSQEGTACLMSSGQGWVKHCPLSETDSCVFWQAVEREIEH